MEPTPVRLLSSQDLDEIVLEYVVVCKDSPSGPVGREFFDLGKGNRVTAFLDSVTDMMAYCLAKRPQNLIDYVVVNLSSYSVVELSALAQLKRLRPQLPLVIYCERELGEGLLAAGIATEVRKIP